MVHNIDTFLLIIIPYAWLCFVCELELHPARIFVPVNSAVSCGSFDIANTPSVAICPSNPSHSGGVHSTNASVPTTKSCSTACPSTQLPRHLSSISPPLRSKCPIPHRTNANSPFKRLPIGSPPFPISTQALSSNLTTDPSFLCIFFAVLTTTACLISPRRTLFAAEMETEPPGPVSGPKFRCF